jgi:hypothetical protein
MLKILKLIETRTSRRQQNYIAGHRILRGLPYRRVQRTR